MLRTVNPFFVTLRNICVMLPDMGAKELGRWVFERRKALGWTQKDLSQRAGISRSYVSQIEHGRPPADDIRVSLAQALDSSIQELLTVLHSLPGEGTVVFGWIPVPIRGSAPGGPLLPMEETKMGILSVPPGEVGGAKHAYALRVRRISLSGRRAR